MDLAKEVTTRQSYAWDEAAWVLGKGYGKLSKPRFNVVAVDYGAKRNILRCLAAAGCDVTVVPADASADDVLRHKPDGVFLSNGPGDPAATGVYAVPVIKELIATGKPIFGICLGHQLLSLASGLETYKMHHGHRGCNHPVKNLISGRSEITSQNHGFAVKYDETKKESIKLTHINLNDDSVEGIMRLDKPAFSVQHHPEASPGPHDSLYLFDQFIELMSKHKK
jgi:carbamoyl-phosphate synthase small subunit